MEKIEVFVCSAEKNNESIKCLTQLFQDDFFEFKVIAIPNSSITIKNNFDLETYRLMKILKLSSPEKYTLFLKDNINFNVSTTVLKTIIKSVMLEQNWDICYLSKWMDRCDLYSEFPIKKIKNINSCIVKTLSPNGIQSLLFSPQGKEIILGTRKMHQFGYFKPDSSLNESFRFEIQRGNLLTLAVTPNIFNFNVLLMDDVSDLAKLTECRRPIEGRDKKRFDKIPGHPLFWFVGVVVLTILILWILHTQSNKNK